jgi:hypothetical protein
MSLWLSAANAWAGAVLHAALKPSGALLVSNPRGQDEEGFVDGRYACFYSFTSWRRLVSSSGFALVGHYYRTPRLCRV